MEPFYCGTSIAEPPDFKGETGAAWRVNMPPIGQRGRPDFDGTVDLVIVRQPGSHPCWDHWLISLVHLRQIPGVKPAHLRSPEMTHELQIAALDPGQPLPAVSWHPDVPFHLLRPIDVVEQFAASDDATAAAVLDQVVRVIVEGWASPDQDWRRWWNREIAAFARTTRVRPS